MQKWFPDPFPVGGSVSPVVGGIDIQCGTLEDREAGDVVVGAAPGLRFLSETGYGDARALLGTLTRAERTELFELAEIDVAAQYEARLAAQAEEHELHLKKVQNEFESRFAAWTDSLSSIVRDDLQRAAAGAAALAVQIAGKIVRATVVADHDVLTRGIATIVFKQQIGSALTVYASPRDAAWLAEQRSLREQLNVGVVTADRRLGDGDCRIRSDGREWDLTVDGQLETLTEIIEEALAIQRGDDQLPAERSQDEPRLD